MPEHLVKADTVLRLPPGAQNSQQYVVDVMHGNVLQQLLIHCPVKMLNLALGLRMPDPSVDRQDIQLCRAARSNCVQLCLKPENCAPLPERIDFGRPYCRKTSRKVGIAAFFVLNRGAIAERETGVVVQNGERIAVVPALHTDADAEARKVFLCFFTRIHAVLRFVFSFSFSSHTPYGTMVTRLSSSSSGISTDERFQPRSPRQSPAIRSFGSVENIRPQRTFAHFFIPAAEHSV